jgi:hypothetical protein
MLVAKASGVGDGDAAAVRVVYTTFEIRDVDEQKGTYPDR